MAKQLWLNNFDTELTGAVKALPDTGSPSTELGYGIIQLSGAVGTVLPALSGGNWFLLTLFVIDGGLESNMEIVKVTEVDTSGGTETRLTVERGQEGTTIRAYAIGDKVSMRMTAATAANFAQLTMNLGDLPNPSAALSNLGGEPAITGSTTDKFWRGDKTWVDFAATVRATTLAGLSTATNAAITVADTVLGTLGKLQKQITDHFGAGGTAHANATAGGTAGFMTGSDKTKLDGVATGATANSSDATLLARANHTGSQLASTISDFAATVRSTVLTGLSTATNAAIESTDAVLAALGKLQAQITGHTGATSGAHAASAISNTPAGNIAATTVQAAINELDGEKQATLVSGGNIKTLNGSSLLGSGNLSVGGGEPTTLALAYNSDNTVNTVTEDGVVKTLSYNADGTVNTISWSVGGGLTRTQTFSYTGGDLTGMTTAEA